MNHHSMAVVVEQGSPDEVLVLGDQAKDTDELPVEDDPTKLPEWMSDLSVLQAKDGETAERLRAENPGRRVEVWTREQAERWLSAKAKEIREGLRKQGYSPEEPAGRNGYEAMIEMFYAELKD